MPPKSIALRPKARVRSTRAPAWAVACAAACAALPGGARAQVSAEPDTSVIRSAVAAARGLEPTLGRDSTGRVTLRAHRLRQPLALDGRLDDAIYGQIASADAFVQQDPREGDPASERTEAWVFFDDANVYIAVRCWDSQPQRMIANELRRDGSGINQGENIAVVLDTFLDRRNGFYFQTNPLGVLRDQEVRDEGNQNPDWNAVWDVRSARFEQGWALEMAIPFKSLRYAGAGPQSWGINIRRQIAHKNERIYLTPMPLSYGQSGIYKFSQHATLLGLETPPKSLNVEVKPYAIASLTTDRVAAEPYSNRRTTDAGFDLKYGLTPGLTADLTVNTDFAQVEADEQQVNLTRFSLQLPEKRDFFLEGRGIFAFGNGAGMPTQGAGGGGGAGGRGGGGGGGGGGDSGGAGPADVPVMFFSRQIGVLAGKEVPVRVGARVTGRAGAYTIGALDVQTGDREDIGAAATNFSVLRVKRDVLSRSSVGFLATHRRPATTADGSNTAVGVDANFQFHRDWETTAYYARTETPGLGGNDASYRAQLAYYGDRHGLVLSHLLVGDAFNPEVGFARRKDFRFTNAVLRFSPRPASIPWIRRLSWQATLDYITDQAATRVESRETRGEFRVELDNADSWSLQYSNLFERLEDPFRIATDVTLPAGGYHFQSVNAGYGLGPQHRVTGRFSVEHGSFYNGTRTAASYGGRIELSSRLSLEPNVSQNWVDLDQGSFDRTLVTTRVIFSPSARSVLSSLLQYNSSNHTWSSNVRFRWEYRPGSDLFLVYSDGRDTSVDGFPRIRDRTLALKATRFLRF
jgi:uncharacterized membrane protein YgcG